MATHPDDVDRMIAYLQEHRAEIVRLGFGSVTFYLGGGEIKAEVKSVKRLPPVERKSA
jgi:hypothetical protein